MFDFTLTRGWCSKCQRFKAFTVVIRALLTPLLKPNFHASNKVSYLSSQVGHTNPGLLVVKFAKYVNQGRSVEPLQRARVPDEDHDIAFTKEYFDNVRKGAEPFGDPLLRTIIVLRGPEWSIQRVGAINCLRNVYNIIVFFAFSITFTFTGSCCTKCMTYVCILTQIVSPALRLSN